MSITYVTGNIFDSQCQTLVNPVNCVGVMGKGLALTFKNIYPRSFARYQRDCARGVVRLGSVRLYEESPERGVLLFPTKHHWRDQSRMSDIRNGMIDFLVFADPRYTDDSRITSVAFPALGCGEGGLDWAEVKPVMESYLGNLDIPIEIYEPVGDATRDAPPAATEDER